MSLTFSHTGKHLNTIQIRMGLRSSLLSFVLNIYIFFVCICCRLPSFQRAFNLNIRKIIWQRILFAELRKKKVNRRQQHDERVCLVKAFLLIVRIFDILLKSQITNVYSTTNYITKYTSFVLLQ